MSEAQEKADIIIQNANAEVSTINALSVSWEYLALPDGPGGFSQIFT